MSREDILKSWEKLFTLSGQISRNHLYDKLKVDRKKNVMKRDPSAWEYAEKKYPRKSCSKKMSSMGSLHGCRQSRSMSSHVRKFPFLNAVPKFVVPFINDYYNVKADGNCRYRSIAYFIYSDEEK